MQSLLKKARERKVIDWFSTVIKSHLFYLSKKCRAEKKNDRWSLPSGKFITVRFGALLILEDRGQGVAKEIGGQRNREIAKWPLGAFRGFGRGLEKGWTGEKSRGHNWRFGTRNWGFQNDEFLDSWKNYLEGRFWFSESLLKKLLFIVF